MTYWQQPHKWNAAAANAGSKQWGDWAPVNTVPEALPRSVVDDGTYSAPMGRYGKKISGRLLGDRAWDGLPHLNRT